MGLSDYNRKRDFRVTSEPPGRPGASATGRSFVIQKHAATRLHYDFRLELDGVLKSWSVPKGPSFDPTVKRLAVAVEDHPIDYGGFEGIIPHGQYGGGTVLLWDCGTWTPLSPPAESLTAGQLKFELLGQKLRGRWVLVKLKERPGRRGPRVGPEDRSWLLIKERDQFARAEAEGIVTDDQPESVVSGRDMGAIAAAADRVWHSERSGPDSAGLPGARAAPMPDSFQPAMAKRVHAVPTARGWVHEIELSGERVICRIGGGHAHLFAVDGRDRTRVLAALAGAARSLPVHDAILDGIATALGPNGQTLADRPADTLYLFDCPYLDGQDLTRVPLGERKALLESLVAASGPAAGLRYTDHVVGRGGETFRAATQLGARGVVSKRTGAPYREGPKTTDDWRVISCPGAQKKGRVGKGGRILEAADPAGVAAAPNNAAGGGVATTSARDVQIAGVRLTHPGRVLYPEVGVTKLDLARFYEQVASLMLPYVEDRPLTLVRAPDGVTGSSFYVRRPGAWAPRELRQVEIPEGSGSGLTMIVDDVAGLVALAQMNVLEIHTWNARASRIEQPDRLVFDLDPGPNVAWSAIVEGAVHVRAALELLDLESFVKTTGSKGLHVVVPLVPAAGWPESLAFTRTIAQAISRAEPGRYTAALAKAGREDKILIDYLRNRRGATSVGVYSSRARPMASVSVPVAWDDLGPDIHSDTFRVNDWRDWLTRRRDPWAGYAGVRQRLTPARLKQAQELGGNL